MKYLKHFLFAFGILLCSSNICGQQKTILQSDTIYLWEGNREFIQYADSVCAKLSSRKKDSLMLFYDFDSGNNIIIISKRNKKVNCFFIHQLSRFDKIETDETYNPVLAQTDISKMFESLNRIDIKSFDTSRYSSGNGMVYCKFYFNTKEKIFSGWYDNFKLAIWDINEYFLAEFVKIREKVIGKSNSVNSQTNDTTAIRIVESSLMSVEKYLKNSKEDSSRLIGRAVWFLTEITGIPSRSDGNFLGQFSPTWIDYYNWTSWIVLNKKNLFWDDEKKTIVIHKTVNALEENIPNQKNISIPD